jgi:hypothetical protein
MYATVATSSSTWPGAVRTLASFSATWKPSPPPSPIPGPPIQYNQPPEQVPRTAAHSLVFCARGEKTQWPVAGRMSQLLLEKEEKAHATAHKDVQSCLARCLVGLGSNFHCSSKGPCRISQYVRAGRVVTTRERSMGAASLPGSLYLQWSGGHGPAKCCRSSQIFFGGGGLILVLPCLARSIIIR